MLFVDSTKQADRTTQAAPVDVRSFEIGGYDGGGELYVTLSALSMCDRSEANVCRYSSAGITRNELDVHDHVSRAKFPGMSSVFTHR